MLNEGWKLLVPETGDDVTEFHIKGSCVTLEIAQQVGARRAYLKGGSPSCDKDGVTGEVLRRSGFSRRIGKNGVYRMLRDQAPGAPSPSASVSPPDRTDADGDGAEGAAPRSSRAGG